ncbi:MAG: hypothetical protein KBI07_04000, partial [Candidatus Atribacteria bacterium]|nr:hypothetical protein [Candidatus Atribacteria bacterium]
QGEEFPLRILVVKQDSFSLTSIFLEGFQGIPPLIILLVKQDSIFWNDIFLYFLTRIYHIPNTIY